MIKIVISGTSGSGKSTLLTFLKKSLEMFGAKNIEVEDHDSNYLLEEENLGLKLNSICRVQQITIKTLQVMRNKI